MIQIMVSGEWLDMPQQEVTISWKNVRFTGLIADAYSTDMELPLTKRNIRLLDVWGLDDRSGQPFGSGTLCQVVTSNRTFRGELHVTEVGTDTMTVALMELMLPSSLNAQVNRLVLDDSATVIDWTDQTLESGGVAPVNLTQYDYGIEPESTPDAVYYPNIKLNDLFDKIGAAAGVTIAHVGTDFRLLATRRVVCPQNEKLAVLFHAPLFTPNPGFNYVNGVSDIHGQHIALDTVTLHDPNMGLDFTALRANRTCRMKMEIGLEGNALLDNHGDMEVVLRSGGVETRQLYLVIGSTPYFRNITVDMLVGDELFVRYGLQRGDIELEVATRTDVLNYSVGYDDYDTALAYVGDAMPGWTGWTDLSYTYYGVMCNLPSMTVRELLSGIAWKIGKKVKVSGNSVTFADDTDVQDIEGEVLARSFTSDKLGQMSRFVSADGVVLRKWAIDNDYLVEEKDVNKSVFKYVNDTQNRIGEMARVPQYEWKEDGNGGATLAVTEVKEPVLVRCENYTLLAYKVVNTLGLVTLTRTVEIEVRTTADVSGLDYVRLLGHTYMLEEGDRDEGTGLTTFKALLI